MSEEFMNRLRDADPAATAEPDVDALRTKVFAHVDETVVSLRPRAAANRWLRTAAAVGALALAAGGGFWGGVGQRDLAVETVAPTGGVVAADAGSASKFAAGDSRSASYMGYWGSGTVLQPGSGIGNATGSAAAYGYSDEGLDRKAFLQQLMRALDISPTAAITEDQGNLYVNDAQGKFNASVGADGQAWFYAYNAARSPWNCGQAEGGAVSPDGRSTDCAGEWKAPTKAQAIAAARDMFAGLGVDVDNTNVFIGGASDSSLSVYMAPRVLVADAERGARTVEVQTYWTAEVSSAGVFSINGSAAKIVELATYPTVGARDAALRVAQVRWAFAGPQQVWRPDADGGVVADDGTARTAPGVPERDGKPMLTAYVNNVPVQSATRSLMQVWLADGTAALMPAWTYTAADGTQWQVLAITEAYVDWSQTQTGGIMPLAR